MTSRLHQVISLQGGGEEEFVIRVEELGGQCEGGKEEEPYTISAME